MSDSENVPPSDRPLRLEYLDPEQLAAHPRNWKFHPQSQLDAVVDLHKRVGWAGALLYNEATGRLLDGHGRRETFKGKGPVPVLIGRWTEEQETDVLRFLDPSGWLAIGDKRALALLDDAAKLAAEQLDSPVLQDLLSAVEQAAQVTSLSATDDAPLGQGPSDSSAAARPGRRPRAGDVPDAVWPTDNVFGVPCLDPKLQADAVEFPVTIWGAQGQTRPMRGTWAFYANDSTFDHVWSNPAKLLPSGAPCYVEPNWSTADQTPFACSLWSIYRRRWISRYLQSNGRRVFVDLNLHHSLLEVHDATPGARPALLGVPRGWKAYATRAHANRPEMLDAEYSVAVEHADGATPLFLVYGGGKRVEQLARDRGWVWVPERADVAKSRATPADPSQDQADNPGSE